MASCAARALPPRVWWPHAASPRPAAPLALARSSARRLRKVFSFVRASLPMRSLLDINVLRFTGSSQIAVRRHWRIFSTWRLLSITVLCTDDPYLTVTGREQKERRTGAGTARAPPAPDPTSSLPPPPTAQAGLPGAPVGRACDHRSVPRR